MYRNAYECLRGQIAKENPWDCFDGDSLGIGNEGSSIQLTQVLLVLQQMSQICDINHERNMQRYMDNCLAYEWNRLSGTNCARALRMAPNNCQEGVNKVSALKQVFHTCYVARPHVIAFFQPFYILQIAILNKELCEIPTNINEIPNVFNDCADSFNNSSPLLSNSFKKLGHFSLFLLFSLTSRQNSAL